MKIYPFLLTSLISALSLSCKDDQVNQGGGTVEGKLITLGISSSDYNVASRTQDESSWATGDEIGAFAFDASTTDAIEGWQNVKYSCSETGSTAIFKSDTPLAIDKEDTPVSIVAYYPYKSDIQGTYYNIDLSNQNDGTSAYDFMYGTSEPCNYGSDEMSNVNITFSHRFSKIRLKVVNMAGEQLSTSDGKISGMPVETSVNLANGAMETSTAAGELIPYWNSTDGYYEAVIFPSALSDNYKFSFNAGGKSHEWVFTDIEDIDLPYFNRGYQYTFSIFMNDEGMVEVGRLESIEEGNSSSPWPDEKEVIGIASAVTYSFYPENLATNAFADTELKITFRDKTPKIGTEGYIRIYDAVTDKVADEINMADEHTPFPTESTDTEPRKLHTWMNIIGMQSKKSGSRNRKVVINYYPVEIEGNTVVIKPHCQKLQPGKKYYVTVDKTAIDVNGFYGITGADWTFTTKANPTDAEVKVSHTDENADFYTLQHTYYGSLSYRYYIPLGRSKVFGIFSDISLNFGAGQGKTVNGKGDSMTGTYQKILDVGIDVIPGIAVFVTNEMSVEASVGILGLEWKRISQTTNQVYEGSYQTSKANFKLNLLSINIGVNFVLPVGNDTPASAKKK